MLGFMLFEATLTSICHLKSKKEHAKTHFNSCVFQGYEANARPSQEVDGRTVLLYKPSLRRGST